MDLYRAFPYTYEMEMDSDAFMDRVREELALLAPDVGIELSVYGRPDIVECMLTDPLASRVRILEWSCNGYMSNEDRVEDVRHIIPLIANCSGLVELDVRIADHLTLNFVAEALEAGCVARKLTLGRENYYGEESTWFFGGNITRFFGALAKSRVDRLVLFGNHEIANPTFERCLCEYLQKDLLVELEISRWEENTVLCAIEGCRNLVKLELEDCTFPPGLRLPPVTNLTLRAVDVGEEYSWSCLTTVRVLCVTSASEIDGRGLSGCAQLCRALISPDCAVRELTVGCDVTHDLFKKVVWHPSCRLTKLHITTWMDLKFEGCQKLFALLQGQQLKKRGSPLRRLPVEMIRMVAAFI